MSEIRSAAHVSDRIRFDLLGQFPGGQAKARHQSLKGVLIVEILKDHPGETTEKCWVVIIFGLGGAGQQHGDEAALRMAQAAVDGPDAVLNYASR